VPATGVRVRVVDGVPVREGDLVGDAVLVVEGDGVRVPVPVLLDVGARVVDGVGELDCDGAGGAGVRVAVADGASQYGLLSGMFRLHDAT